MPSDAYSLEHFIRKEWKKKKKDVKIEVVPVGLVEACEFCSFD